jgi:MFS family permease
MNTSAIDSQSTLAPLRIRVYRDVWLASMASNLGGLVQGVGAAWLMTSIAPSADMVALVQTSNTLPVMLFAVLGGAISDGFDRRRVMLAAQSFMFVASMCLAVAALFDLLTPWTLLTFTFLIGCGNAFYNPAWQASVGDMVPREDIGAAVLLNSVSFNVTRSVGPAAGGAIVASVGASAAFGVNALSYIGLIAVLWRWRPPATTRTIPRENLGAAILAGLRYVSMSPKIGKVLLRGSAFGAASIVVLALLPLVTRDLLGGSALVYGSLLGAYGIGAVGGAFISKPARERFSNEQLVRLTFLAFVLCTVIVAVSHTAWMTAAGLLLGGAAWVMALSLFNTIVQLSTPRWVVGRALSLYQVAIFGGMALGSWCWGNLAEHFGVALALLMAAGAMLAAAAIGLKLPLPGNEALNLDPLDRWREPETGLDIKPQSGPVRIAVEYEIAATTIPEFLEIMEERQRIRRRDGAHNWTLLRDVGDPRYWVESFEMPTWIDYVRLHARATQADADVVDRIRALHVGTEPPKVRRLLLRNPGRGRVEPPLREVAEQM